MKYHISSVDANLWHVGHHCPVSRKHIIIHHSKQNLFLPISYSLDGEKNSNVHVSTSPLRSRQGMQEIAATAPMIKAPTI